MADTRHPFLKTFVVGAVAENAYLIRDDKDRVAAWVDPGDFTDEMRTAAEGYKIQAVYLTHAHFDHLMGVREIKLQTRAPVFMHPDEQSTFDWHSESIRQFLGIEYSAPQPDRSYREGDVVRVGSIELRVSEAPGHTPGHVMLVGDGFALVGDVIFQGSIGRTDLPGGDLQTLLDSIRRKVASLPPHTVLYSGHGPETTVAEEVARSPFMKAALGELRVL
jgi:glyoxylase-like metal-dependent hydrolase (beta-lactamase superfamily II)